MQEKSFNTVCVCAQFGSELNNMHIAIIARNSEERFNVNVKNWVH